NGKRVDIASYRVKQGDVIGLREKSRKIDIVESSLTQLSLQRPEWLSFDEGERSAEVLNLPDSESVPFPIDILLVVEYYAKRL
ncbi:MAG TPA: 30S ribosomal protein S4, partial [Myxococcales bacterium]|nr:30S ribosomal protein S4 [Myxococcales bacterium]